MSEKFKKTGKFSYNKYTLFFKDNELENRFRKRYFNKSIKYFRISFLLVTFLYAVFGLLDLLTSKQFVTEFYLVRYGIVLPVLLVTYGLSFTKTFYVYWQQLLVFCYVVGGSGIVYMLHRHPENPYYYGGIFLIVMAGSFFIKLRFTGAVISSFLLLAIYNVWGFIAHGFTGNFATNMVVMNTFFIAAILIANFALYNLELLERKDFLQRHLLLIQQEEIKKNNETLGQQVYERTQLLNDKNQRLEAEILQRKETENKLILAKEKAEESERLKTAFLTNMSHEIRTPLNGILGFVDLLNDDSFSKEQKTSFSEMISKSGARLLATINDILEISKIEAGQTPMNYQTVFLYDLVDQLFNLSKQDASQKKLAFILDNKPDNLVVRTDELKLTSILSNLLRNALKFTSKGYIRLSYTDEGEYIKFVIEDTGIGIPENKTESIFNRFEQADYSTTRGYEGSGLGLSICKAYVEMLGGKIWVDSNQGVGSTFFFTIIKEEVDKISKNLNDKNNKTRQVAGKKFKILLAEDDLVSINLMENLLIDKFEVVVATNGKKVVEIFKAHNDFDIVLMDIKMPVFDGIEATKLIRELNRQIPIIAQTAHAMEGDKVTAINAGCNDYISKPINSAHLFELLDKYLS